MALTSPAAIPLFFVEIQSLSPRLPLNRFTSVCVCVCHVNSVFVRTQCCVMHMQRSGGRLIALICSHCKDNHTVSTANALWLLSIHHSSEASALPSYSVLLHPLRWFSSSFLLPLSGSKCFSVDSKRLKIKSIKTSVDSSK